MHDCYYSVICDDCINKMKNMKYLLWFANENIEFRKAEIDSLLKLLKIEMKFIQEPQGTEPYWIVEFDNEDEVKKLAERSVSLKVCLELWGYADNIFKLHSILKNHQKSFYDTHFSKEKSFKIEVETFCKHFTQREKIEKIEQFDYLPVQGDVNLKNPDVCLQYIEYYGTIPTKVPEEPYFVFFGKWVTDGLRQLIQTLSLKSRKFIGNTSMDPQFSLLMANQAQIKKGDVVLDPFVGSGSLLIAAAQFGGYVLGTDINYLMLHGKSKPSRIKQKVRDKNESVKANMEQYKISHQYLDVMVNDFSCSFWRDNLQFDAIITDPPYGIREATEKVGTERENRAIKEEYMGKHFPSKIEYGIARIYGDLLKFSLKHLKLGGRLVCWFPVFREDYTEGGLPSHPCMKLVANSEQVLSKLTSRRLLTYEKIQVPITELDVNINNILDFREKYYEAREETRNEKRIREAKLREENRLKYLNKK